VPSWAQYVPTLCSVGHTDVFLAGEALHPESGSPCIQLGTPSPQVPPTIGAPQSG